jgi:isopenicillin-N epimerase
MFTRRSFLTRAGAASLTMASFNEPGIERAVAATRYVRHLTAEEVAQNEDFWFEVQQAFTVDRSIINLNNGGVCPSPRVVQEAMRHIV